MDPTPGDPVVVADGATRYRQVADAINRCAQSLRALEAGSSRAESVTALLESRDTIVDGVTKAENRYRVAADALDSYAQVLDRVQTDTLNALYAAKDAVTDRDDANRMKAHYQDLADEHRTDGADDGGDDGSYARYTRLCRTCGADADAAQNRIDAQIQIVDQAVADRDTAAQQAIDAIETTTAADGLNDSWWDNWGATLVTWIAKIAEAVAAIAGILALVLCWVPVIGQALLVLSAVAGIIAAVANVILAATGEQSWTQAIVSIAFAALGCVGLGGLKALGKVAVQSMLKQTLKLAGAESPSGSKLGAFLMKTVLRRGATSRIVSKLGGPFLQGRNRMVGQLGEELMLVKPGPKVSFDMGKYGGTAGQMRIPDINLKLGPLRLIGDVKFVKNLTATRQLRDFANIAKAEGLGGRLHIFHPQSYTASTSALTDWAASTKGIEVSLHSIESFVGTRIAAPVVAGAGIGQVSNN